MKKLLFLSLFITSVSFAQQTISLYEGLAPNSTPSTLKDSTIRYGNIAFMIRIITPELTLYFPEKDKATGMAVVVCPGGGYTGLAMEHEGHAIAKKLQENGIAGFVLKYRMPNAKFVTNKEFVPLQDWYFRQFGRWTFGFYGRHALYERANFKP
jgi:acetyl esterase/lipase